MASIIDSFSDALNDDLAYVKFIIYAIPVYFCADLFLQGKMDQFYFWGTIVGIILFTILTKAINNSSTNSKEIITFKPLDFIVTLIKTSIVIAPQLGILYYLGALITKINIPLDVPHLQLIFQIVVWSVLSSIILTSYIVFAGDLSIKKGYNYKVILPASIDILVSLLFAIPQFIIANIVLIGPLAYVLWYFHVPFTHWSFVGYCSVIAIVNVSLVGNYFAQIAQENIRDKNEFKNDHQLNYLIDDTDTNKNI